MTADTYFREWLLAFALTQAIEMPIYCFALRPPWRAPKAFGASAITHPVIWFVIAPLMARHYLPMVVCAEIFAVGVEALYLRLLKVRSPLTWSLVGNGASFAAGALFYFLRGWL